MNGVGRRIGAVISRSLALCLTGIGLTAAAEVSDVVARQENTFQVEAKLMVALSNVV